MGACDATNCSAYFLRCHVPYTFSLASYTHICLISEMQLSDCSFTKVSWDDKDSCRVRKFSRSRLAAIAVSKCRFVCGINISDCK